MGLKCIFIYVASFSIDLDIYVDYLLTVLLQHVLLHLLILFTES